jgi:Mannosyltransferase (PIG-V)
VTVINEAKGGSAVSGRAVLHGAWQPLRRLTASDRVVLRIWVFSRCAVLALSWPAMWILQGSSRSDRSWLGLWQQWDAERYQSIAQYGYFHAIAEYGYFGPAAHPEPVQVAFLPGYPIVLAAVHLIVREWTIAELLVSFIAGAVAAVALGRIADRDFGRGLAGPAVLYLVVSPAAIFLAVGYAESLFLALALCAWLAARGGRWPLALLLAGAAAIVRTNGLFLCAALLVAIIAWDGPGRRRALAMFPLCLLPPAGYELYLRVSTGDWLAWSDAEKAGWQRQLTNPIKAFHTTWAAGFGHEYSAPISFVFQLEPFAVLVGLVVTVALLVRRRWPEAVYAGLTIAALATSIWYESVPRALLLIWPVWCGLAYLARNRPWIGQLYLVLAVPVSAAIGLLYLTGNWAG